MRLWLCYLSLLISLILMLASTFADKHYSVQLGFQWRPAITENNTVQGWRVTASHLPQLKVASLLTHVWVQNTWVALDKRVLLSTPDYAGSLANVKQAFELDQKLHELYSQPIRFKQSTGKIISVQAQAATWHDLSTTFWLYRGVFLLGILLAWVTLIWHKNTYKQEHNTPPNEVSGRFLLCLSFICSSLTLVLSVAAISRSFGVPDWYLWTKFVANMTVVALNSLLFLRLWLTQPTFLPKQHALWRMLWVVACIIYSFNIVFLLTQQAYAIDYLRASSHLLAVLFICIFSLQWWLTRKDGVSLVDKVSMQMVFVFGLLASTLFTILNFIIDNYLQSLAFTPNLILGLISLTSNSVLFVLLFRHQLYRIMYWWWLFYALLAGALVLLVSFAILSQFGLHTNPIDIGISLIASLLTVSALAFFFQYRLMQNHISLLLNASLLLQKLRQTQVDSNSFWIHQKQLFMQALDSKEAEIIELKQGQSDIQIICAGEKLQLGITKNKGLRLSAPNKGRRLFNQQDIKNLSMLKDLSNAQQREQAAFIAGEKQTRKQVAYDLHDDIGGRLHQLAHGDTQNAADYAQKTLEQLRTLTHALHKDNQPLSLFLASLRHDLLRHAQSCNVEMSFDIATSTEIQSQELSAMAMVQLNSIMGELCRNALQHQGVTSIEVSINAKPEQTSICFSNNGVKTCVKDWIAGLGTVSIKRRVHQLDGHVQWKENANGGVTTELILHTQKWLTF